MAELMWKADNELIGVYSALWVSKSGKISVRFSLTPITGESEFTRETGPYWLEVDADNSADLHNYECTSLEDAKAKALIEIELFEQQDACT